MSNRHAVIAGAIAAALIIPGGAALAAASASNAEAEALPPTKQEARLVAAEAVTIARQAQVAPDTIVAALTASAKAGSSAKSQLADAKADALAAKYTPAYAKAYARKYMKQKFGWGDGEYHALVTLWTRESNWDHTAENPTSGAYGIPQSLPADKMASEGRDWRTNPEPQIRWGLKYISEVYGTPSATVAFWNANNWY